ncbi:MAG: ketol-acid reductoisomerase [Fimbriimonadaceae bacterium]
MARFFDEAEAPDLADLGLTVAVIGYGNQGHAHAQNLRDSGVKVIVGARASGKAHGHATADGFEVFEIADAVQNCDILMLTLPDVAMQEIVKHQVIPGLHEGQTVLFAHGFNVVYGYLKFPKKVDVGLVSPKGAGAKLRSQFLDGSGLAALVAVEQDATGEAWNRVLGYARGIGSFRSVVMETSFREETHTDLFGEQTVLCGGIPELLKMAFTTLVKAGYSPEAAYFECIHEAKLITDLIYDRGMEGMRQAISDTAEWGGFEVGPRVISRDAQKAMDESLRRIQSGEFAAEWMEECAKGQVHLRAQEVKETTHESVPVGQVLREKMKIQP